jgi:hypothetical protein
MKSVRLNELKQPVSEDWPDYASQREIRSMAKEILHYRVVEQHAQVWQYRQYSKNGTWSDWAYISESSFQQHFLAWARKCRGVFEGASAEIRALGVIVPYQSCAGCLNTYRPELNQIET